MKMTLSRIGVLAGLGLAAFGLAPASAAPVAVNGSVFTLVATGPGTTQLFGLTSDDTGRIYVGNNSNTTTGIPVQRFDPALFSGSAISLQSFGPAVGDADGLAFSGGKIFVADRDDGLRATTVATQASSILIPGVAINGTGSPIVVRPSDGHIFVGLGGLTGTNRIDEYDAAGAFVKSHATGTDVETMTFDVAAGLIYYAPFGSNIRVLNPLTDLDVLVGSSSGTIDGGLALDPISGKLFVGTANGGNSGLVETIDPVTHVTSPFASGFDGSLGILRDPVTGDLFFLETNALWRLDSRDVGVIVPTSDVPEPASLTLLGGALLGLAAIRRRAR